MISDNIDNNNNNNNNNKYTCRICLDDDCSRADVIAPCSCSGSSKWVHRSCLDRWRTTREDKAFSKCTECLFQYRLVCLSGEDTNKSDILRQIRFTCYVIRDVLIALLLVQLSILFFGFVAYFFDYKDHKLEKYLHFENHPYLFYYLVGLVVILAIVGMSGACVYSNICPNNTAPCCPNNTSPCFCDCPYCFFGGPSDVVPVCPGGCGCHHCCAGVDCACCDTAGGCLACDCSALGAEAAIFLFGLVAIFAVIGLFISIIAGVFFTQYIIRKHFHILSKRAVAEDYIVADLAADPNCVKTDDVTGTISPMSILHNSQRYNRLDDEDGVEMGEIMDRGFENQSQDPAPSAPTFLSRNQELVLVRMGLM